MDRTKAEAIVRAVVSLNVGLGLLDNEIGSVDDELLRKNLVNSLGIVYSDLYHGLILLLEKEFPGIDPY